jgi:hypothetical protein
MCKAAAAAAATSGESNSVRSNKDVNAGLREYWESFPAGALIMRVQTLAWNRRAENPLITVRTYASGADARTPAVTAMPRSVWESLNPQGEAYEVFPLRAFFARECFQRDASFCVALDLHHPGRGCSLSPTFRS